MASQHELRCTYEREKDGITVESAEVVITFSFFPGSPAFYSRGIRLPAEDDEIYFIRAEQDLGGGKRMPACETLSGWAADYLDNHNDEAREEAWECLEADRADAEERRHEARRDDLMIEQLEGRR